MLHDIERGAHCTLGSIFKESVSSPLVLDDAGYLTFFTRVMKRLKEGAKKVGMLVEEESRDLLAQVVTRVFNHLLCSDPDFDFEAVIAPVPGVIHDALGDWVEDNMDALSAVHP